MEVGISIELQEGVTARQWRSLVDCIQDSVFTALSVSDHLRAVTSPNLSVNLESTTALSYAAARLQHVELGILVSPVTFRAAALLAHTANSLYELSEGRHWLGLGAGWFRAEHTEAHLPFPSYAERLAKLREVSLQLRDRFSASGPRIVIGGSGEGLIKVAAECAGEWNAPGLGLSRYVRLRRLLEEHLYSFGRTSIRSSLVMEHAVGDSSEEVGRRTSELLASTPVRYRPGASPTAPEWLVGTAACIRGSLAAYADAGVDRVMLQWRKTPNAAEVERVSRIVGAALGTW